MPPDCFARAKYPKMSLKAIEYQITLLTELTPDVGIRDKTLLY